MKRGASQTRAVTVTSDSAPRSPRPGSAAAAFFSEISKFLQKNIFPGMAANLTVDDPMCFDFGMWIAERVLSQGPAVEYTYPGTAAVGRQLRPDSSSTRGREGTLTLGGVQ